MNPTIAVLEERVASLEGGAGAVAFASGLAAQAACFFTLLEPGDHVVASQALYGGTITQLKHLFAQALGRPRLRRPERPRRLARARCGPRRRRSSARRSATRAATCSTSRRSRRSRTSAGAPLIVDNTFATPYLCRPLELRRRHRHPLGDEVPRRPRHVDRRRRRRLGRVRLGERPLPGRHRPVAGLPRARVPRDLRRLRLPDEAARRVAARPRRGAQPVQRLPLPAGPRDAVAADGPPRRERARRSPRSSSRSRRSSACGYAGCASPYRARERYLPRGAGAIFAFDLAGGREAGRRFIEALDALEPPRERRRREEPRHPPGEHDAPPALRRGARRRRDRPRDDPPLGRPRDLDDLLWDLDAGAARPTR